MKTTRNWGVFAYFVGALLAIGLLFVITAAPGSSADLFPVASPDELVQGVQWAWARHGGAHEPTRN